MLIELQTLSLGFCILLSKLAIASLVYFSIFFSFPFSKPHKGLSLLYLTRTTVKKKTRD
jgi:hypothetical protein